MGLKIRHDSAANWTANNPTIETGEQTVETDTGKVKWNRSAFGVAYNSLAYYSTNTNATPLGGGDASTNTSTSVDSEVALFSSTGGKTLKRATGSGLAKLASGVLSTATAGTDYYNPGGTDVAVADGGTGASSAATALSNLGGAPLASPTFTGTPAAPTASAGTNSTQLATTAYVDTSQYAAQPSWHGFKAWSFDPAVVNSNTIIPTAGVINLVKIWCPAAINITSLYVYVQGAGVSLTNVGFGLYDSSANLLQSSVNANGATAVAFQSNGLKPVTVSSQAVAAGAAVYVGFWFTGTTMPTLSRGTTVNVMDANLATPNLRFSTANASLTTTAPNPFTAQSIAAAAWWVAVS